MRFNFDLIPLLVICEDSVITVDTFSQGDCCTLPIYKMNLMHKMHLGHQEAILSQIVSFLIG